MCHDGRQLLHIRTEKRRRDGYEQTVEVYGCADCGGCPHKARCLYKYDGKKDQEKNKVMKINERWEDLKEEAHGNIQKEFLLYAMGRNLNKYHQFRHGKIKKFEGKPEEPAA